MKGKTITMWLGILIAAGVFSGVLLAQKVEPPTPPDPQGLAMSTDHGRRMIYFHGGEGTWLGVTVGDVTAEKAKELNLPGEYGAIVQEVRGDSPAAKAGLEKGDVILQFAGEKVRSVAELLRLVRETPAGRSVAIEISRNGHTQTLSAEIAKESNETWTSRFEMPNVEIPKIHVPNFNFNMMFVGGPRLGIMGDELTPQLADCFGVKQGKGVLVGEVEKGTPAEKAGLKAGDVIVKVNDKQIESIEDLRAALRSDSNEKHEVTLTIVRDRHEQSLNVELEPASQLVGPQRIAEFRELGMNQEEWTRMKSEALAQARAALAQAKGLEKNSELLRVQKEKVRQEVEQAMKEHRKEMEQLKKELEKLRLQQTQEPI
jgi:serine protease Do